jgi:hypothetical protein
MDIYDIMKLSDNAALINRQPARRVRLATIALLAGLTLLGGFGIFAQSGATNRPLDLPNGGDALYPDIPGLVDPYPAVVAYVDGHAISGQILAFRVYALGQNPTLDQSHPVRDALHGAIQDQILIDHASDYGVTVSYNEARAFAQQEKKQILSAPVPAAQADIADRARQMGLSVDDYFNSPSVIQGYREGMILGEMRNYILTRAPVKRPRTAAGEQGALDAFTDSIHAKVRILIDMP